MLLVVRAEVSNQQLSGDRKWNSALPRPSAERQEQGECLFQVNSRSSQGFFKLLKTRLKVRNWGIPRDCFHQLGFGGRAS